MIVAYVEPETESGESKSYYLLFADLVTQLLDQAPAAAIGQQWGTQGRTVDEIQMVFTELLRAWAQIDETVSVIAPLPTTNTEDAVRFLTDLKSFAQEHQNLVLTSLFPDGSEAIPDLDATKPDPNEEFLYLGLPSIEDYKNFARTFACSFDRVLNDATAGLCAALARQRRAPPSFVRTLIAESANYTEFEISQEHVTLALQALDFKPLEPFKDPVTAIPILQAYASLATTERRIKKLPDRQPVPIPLASLRSTYQTITQSLVISPLPPAEFETLLQSLITRELFTTTDTTLSLAPKFCYETYLNHILSWDYHDIADKTPTPPPQQVPLATIIKNLYIGHLAALHAIHTLHTTTPDIVTSATAYPAYVQACTELDLAPVQQNPGFKQLLDALTAKHLIQTERAGRTIEIIPITTQSAAHHVHDRFAAMERLVHTPPTLLTDDQIAQLLPNAPVQRCTLTALHHVLRETGKNFALQSEVYQIYVELCSQKGGTPKKPAQLRHVITDLVRGNYITVQPVWAPKPDNRLFLQ